MTALYDAILLRFGSSGLIQLSNDEGSVTTVNTSRVEAACSDATGKFHAVVGSLPDTANAVHLAILVDGVIAQLENYKYRNSDSVKERQKMFYAQCKSLRESSYSLAATNSVLTPSVQKSGTRPDMDRENPAFRQQSLVASSNAPTS